MSDEMPKEQRRKISYYLPVDVVDAVNALAMRDAPSRSSGRIFSPSLVVERALRAFIAEQSPKPKRGK